MSDAKPISMQVPPGAADTIADGKLRCQTNPASHSRGDVRGRISARERAGIRCAVQKAYGSNARSAGWKCFAGEKANRSFNSWLPDETVAACREYLVSIKGRSPRRSAAHPFAQRALRQLLDLYVCCARALVQGRSFSGARSGEGHMVIFRENTEDIYAGIEFEAGSADVKKFLELFKQASRSNSQRSASRLVGIGLKPAPRRHRAPVRAAVE